MAAMSIEAWLLFTATVTAASLTPGPAVLLVLATALHHRALPAVATILGILAANVVYIAVSVAGLGAAMAASPALFTGLRWAGAAFLVYLGVRLLVARRPALAVGAGPARATASRRGLFLRGFVSQAANPKAVLFYGALFPQFLTPGGRVLLESALLAGTEVVVEFLILLGYATLAAQGARLATRPRFAAITDRVAGALLVTAGVGLAAIRRS